MILIVCIDKTSGMAFNKRRQSKDVRLREQILSLTKERTLLMNRYSMKMFGDHPQIRVNENFLDSAIEYDYCFAENVDVVPYEDKIEKIVLYKWNKTYPSELKFGISLIKWVESCPIGGFSMEFT